MEVKVLVNLRGAIMSLPPRDREPTGQPFSNVAGSVVVVVVGWIVVLSSSFSLITSVASSMAIASSTCLALASEKRKNLNTQNGKSEI